MKIEMLTMHTNDDGSTENIHNLTEAELATRKVDMIDIAFDDVRHLFHYLSSLRASEGCCISKYGLVNGDYKIMDGLEGYI